MRILLPMPERKNTSFIRLLHPQKHWSIIEGDVNLPFYRPKRYIMVTNTHMEASTTYESNTNLRISPRWINGTIMIATLFHWVNCSNDIEKTPNQLI